MRELVTSLTGVIASQLVALVFFLASLGKLLSGKTRRNVEAYGLLSPRAANVMGAGLPWVELAIAACLLSGIMAWWAAITAAVLLLLFSSAQAVVLIRGQEIPCGCFGSLSSQPVRWVNVLANIVLAASALYGGSVFSSLTGFSWPAHVLGHKLCGSLAASEIVLLQLMTAVLFTQYLSFTQVIHNGRSHDAYVRYQRQVLSAMAIHRIDDPPARNAKI